MIDKKICFLLCDFETTGVDVSVDYPIELGGLFLDSKLNILNSVDTLIKLPKDWIKENKNKRRYEDSFQYHKINIEDLELGIDYTQVSLLLSNKLSQLKNQGFEKFILMSDNIQFEFSFMKKIYEMAGVHFPFHYCGWDTSLLLELTDIGDPKNVPHRAFADVGLLYKHLILSVKEIGK